MIDDLTRQEWRAHWRVVLGTFIAMGLGYGGFTFTQSQFIQPIQQAFGWGRGQIAVAFQISFIAGFAAPLYGRLIDHVGVRPVLCICLAVVGAAYVLIANTNGYYPFFVLAFLLMVLAGMGTTGLAFTRAVAGWFIASRGAALAISRIGYSMAGAFLPIVVFHVIARYGWQGGFYFLSALVVFVALPVSWLLVRDRRDTVEAGSASRTVSIFSTGLWLNLARDRRVLFVCLAASFTYGPCVGVLSQLQPLLVSKGLPAATAAEFASLLAISVVIGTLVTGLLVDRIWAPAIGCLFTLLPVVGIVLLLQPAPSATQIGVGLVLIGLAQGAEIDVVAFIIARYFGMRSFATIYGLSVMFISLGTTLAAVGFGYSFDIFGNYDPALIGAAILFVMASISYLLLGRYPAEPSVRALTRPDARR